jgi:hypothetical protein
MAMAVSATCAIIAVVQAVGFAPAIEYSWTPNLGVLLGVRVIPSGRNTTAAIAPVVAINFVR